MGTSAFDRLVQSVQPEAPQRPTDAFGKLLESVGPRADESGTLEALSRNPIASPDEAGEASRLARQFGMPEDVVARNLATVRPWSVRNGPDWSRFTEDAPKTARWLENPVRHAMASDDAETLGLLERLSRSRFVQEFGGAMAGPTSGNVLRAPTPLQSGILTAEWQRGALMQERGQLGSLPLAEQAKPEVQARIAAIDAQLAQPLPEAEGFARFVRGTTRILPGMTAGAVEAGAGAMVGAVVGGTIGALAGGVGAVPGAVAGAKVGGVFGGVSETARQIGGNLSLDLQADGVDPVTADLAARSAGWLGGAVEYTNIGLLLQPLTSRMTGAGTAAALRSPTVRAALGRALRYYGASLGTETAEEVVQQGIELAAGAVAADVSGVERETPDVLATLLETAEETLVSMALLPIPGTAMIGVEGLAQVQTARQKQAGLAQAIDLSRKSKTRQRDAEAFAALVREQTDDQVVYLDAEAATVLLQENEVTPEQFVEAAGITFQQWAEAVDGTGTALAIPVSDLLAKIAPTPLADALLPNIRFELDGPTLREVERLERDADAFQKRVADEAAAVGDIAESDPAWRIVDDVRQKLETAGTYTPEQALTQAQVVAKPYAVWARAIAKESPEHWMADPWALYSRKGGLSVLGGQRAEAVFDAEMAVARAKRQGRTQEEVDALRDRVTRLSDERVAIRAVLEEADQVLDVRDEAGRLRDNLRQVSTDALAVEYVRLREIFATAQANLEDVQAAFARAEQESGAVVTDEEVAGRVEEAGFSGTVPGFEDAETWAGKRVAYDRYLRSLRGQVRKVERSVPRLGRELEARGIENVDAYLRDNGLEGTFAVPSGDVPFQRPLSRAEYVAMQAQDAREWSAGGMTNAEIALELGVNASRVAELLAMPPVAVTPEMELRMAFNGVEMLMQAAFHGSPYVFDRFDLSRIGTGEGAQAYGWGLYFAENEGVASAYRRTLTPDPFPPNDPRNGISQILAHRSPEEADRLIRTAYANLGDGLDQAIADAKQANATTGALYRVDIPDEAVARMLDWDKPLSEQAPEVREAIKRFVADVGIPPALEIFTMDGGVKLDERVTGDVLYRSVVARIAGGQKQASLALLAAGIPGIKYLDAGSRQDGDGTRNLVVFVDALVTITHRNGEPVTAAERTEFLAQEQPQGRRPNAYYLRSSRVIGLMQTANLSSFLHEMSHDYLATLELVATDPAAPAWLVRDFETAMRTLGVSDEDRVAFVQYLRTGMGRDAKETKRFEAAEERWARAFESYLEKGEAPSRDLLRAFATFRVWLGNVYKAIKGLLVPVNPELREVFDRMLATDEEIAEYRQQPEAQPLFTERPEGMTDAQWAEYTKGFQTRDALAGASLARQVLLETRRAVDADWAAKRAEVEDAIREELAIDPLVQAVAFLRDGMDGEPMKLDRAALEAVAPDLWKSLPKGTTAADGQVTADAVAVRFGYSDEATFLADLQRYEEVEAVVRRRSAETFRRTYGDLLGDSTAMADAVAKATHTAETDEPIVRELKALGRQLGMRVVDKPALVQVARDMLAGMRVADILPYRYEQAEAREARAAERAYRDGNLTQAAFHKRRQLLNRILVRESQSVVTEVEKVRAFAVRMQGERAQATLGKAGTSFVDAMDALVGSYEFSPVSRRRLDRRAALAAYIEAVTEKGGVPMLAPALVEDARLVNYRSLTFGDLMGVDAAMRQVWHHAKTVDTIAKEGRRISRAQAAEEVTVALERTRPSEPMDVDGYPLGLAWAKDRANAVDAWHLPPTFLFRWLDGDEYGTTWRTFYLPIKQAEDAELVRMREAAERVKAIEDMVDLPPALLDRPVKYDGIRQKLTRRQVLALASNWGNASSREAVVEARTADGYPQFGSAASIERMFAATMTKADWAYVQARWDYVNEFWPEIAEQERRLNGITPEKIEASPFLIQTKDGQTASVGGGYYPLAYDRKLGPGRGQDRTPLSLSEGPLGDVTMLTGARAQTKHGWTNERTKSAQKPIDLSLGVWNRHIAAVIHDLTHREVVQDVNALLTREDVRQALVRASGVPYYDALKSWLVRVANPTALAQGDVSPIERVLALARVGTTAVNLGLKFTTGVAQTLGYLQSVEAIGPQWMAVGLSELVSDRGDALALVMESSPMMANRRFNYNRDVADYAKSRFGKMTDLDAFNFWFIGAMDGMVSVPTWIGAYRKAMAENGNDHPAAVAYADDVVESTQGAGSAKDLARIQGGPELRKLLTMHYTAFSRMYGQVRRAGFNVKTGKYGVPRFLASMTVLWFGQVVLGELLTGRLDTDDDEWKEKMFWDIVRFPANLLVGVRDLLNAVGPDAFGFKLTPAEAALERTARATQVLYRETLGDLWHGADRELTEAETRALVEAPGYWLRLPTRAVWQYLDYLMDWAQGEVAPRTPAEAAGGLLFNRR